MDRRCSCTTGWTSYSERFPRVSFQSPYNPYVARLLGEVNILTPEQQQELGLPKWFYFPHQLKFSEQEGTDAEVIESGFSGGFTETL